jgi:hypothetical protein
MENIMAEVGNPGTTTTDPFDPSQFRLDAFKAAHGQVRGMGVEAG